MYSASRFFVKILLILGFSQLATAQTVVITYGAAAAAAGGAAQVVPVLGSAGLLVLAMMLLVLGVVWLRKNPNSSSALAIGAVTAGLLASVGSGGWLISNAEAAPAVIEYLFSEHTSPVSVTTFPALLTNDLETAATIESVVVSECPGVENVLGTCATELEIAANGGSCTLESVCDVAPIVLGEGSFTGCVDSWCSQAGTLGQSTRCESASPDGLTCFNPEIRYGSVEGGIPSEHPGNDYAQWCQQLGFTSDTAVTFGARSVTAPNGRLFGCSSYDENTWHWCDWQDGDWLDETLDYHSSSSTEITSISCAPPSPD